MTSKQEPDIQDILKTNFQTAIQDGSDSAYNNFLIRKEAVEREALLKDDKFNYLYPNLNDEQFNIKISEKQEFYDSRYEGDIFPVEQHANKLCNLEMELAPYQIFVRNFLSFQTPYNSLLLYHGLGSGKTCSAIGVAEEMRSYLKQMGITKRIIVVASPNVQDNFKQSLFNEQKLQEVDGLWNIKGCTGNRFIQEINPMSMKGLSKDKVINQIRRIIQMSYLFLGYIEFANLITKKGEVESSISPEKQQAVSDRKLRRFFNDRLIIIDEVHNIRMADDNKNKRIALSLLKLVKVAEHLRLLLLSATPMYNSFKEIVWLINLMNINDDRATIEYKDIFNSDGDFLTDERGQEIGKQTLMRKSTGYVSFVRGENPYTFPYRIFPKQFAPERSLLLTQYPPLRLNNGENVEKITLIDVYINNIGDYQYYGYAYILKNILTQAAKTKKQPSFENMEKFGYSILQPPLEALNIVYPSPSLTLETMTEYITRTPDEITESEETVTNNLLIGKRGLTNIMTFDEIENTNPPQRLNFEYKPWVLERFGSIFSPELISTYSAKMKSISDPFQPRKKFKNDTINELATSIKSQGIILIYSQYIDGGLVPMALVLEELGFIRDTGKSLFKVPPTEPIDSITMKKRSEYTGSQFKPAKYTMITGDKALSPNNDAVMKTVTKVENKEGGEIKVVLISRAGSEGLDFKNIRQAHIMDPWYNMNRNEQIIGRSVRNKSHCDLPFIDRNVEIYLHATILPDNKESVDLYLYRLAELKALQIGKVSRLLKENAVDCLLNTAQNNFTVENIGQTVDQKLSSGKTIKYQVGDKPYSSTCDYMEKCSFDCRPEKSINPDNVKLDTYSEKFILLNTEKIIQRIKLLFMDHYFYSKRNLLVKINAVKQYPLVQIYAALNKLINENTEYLTDRYGRLGNLINIDEYYYFQPIELNFKRISVFERSTPLDYKRNNIDFSVPDDITESILEKAEQKTTEQEEIVTVTDSRVTEILAEIKTNYELATTKSIIIRGEDNWYKYCSIVIEKLTSLTTLENLKRYLISHIIEMLLFEDKMKLLTYLTFVNITDEFEVQLRNYFEKYILRGKNLTGILLENNATQKLYIKKQEGWFEAEPEDYKEMKDEILNYVVPVSNISLMVGFITNFKNQYMIYKVKDMTRTRHTGARCDQAGKAEIIKQLNMIVGSELYDKQNTKKMVQIELCCMQEFILRYYNDIQKDEKHWFFTPEESIVNKIMDIKL